MHVVANVKDVIAIGILGLLLLTSGATIAILYIAGVLKERHKKK